MSQRLPAADYAGPQNQPGDPQPGDPACPAASKHVMAVTSKLQGLPAPAKEQFGMSGKHGSDTKLRSKCNPASCLTTAHSSFLRGDADHAKHACMHCNRYLTQ